MRQEYVMGLMTHEDRVVLTQKNRPEWQAGLLNGVGGKVEPTDHSVYHAMAREFQEETGVKTSPHDWCRVAVGSSEHAVVEFLHIASPLLVDVKTVEDEEVVIMPIADVRIGRGVISNVPWILHLALESMNPTAGPETKFPIEFRF